MRRHFEALGGYDERFVGYGAEDRDFLRRCDRLGLVRDPIPLVYLRALPQDDAAKMDNQPDIDGLRHPTAKRSHYMEINERLVADNDRRGAVRVNPEGFGLGTLEVTHGG